MCTQGSNFIYLCILLCNHVRLRVHVHAYTCICQTVLKKLSAQMGKTLLANVCGRVGLAFAIIRASSLCLTEGLMGEVEKWCSGRVYHSYAFQCCFIFIFLYYIHVYYAV